MRVLGLDVGERRIGAAVSDPDGRMALPLRTLDRRGADEIALVRDLIAETGADSVVVGLPLSLDGSRGPQAELSAAFAERLEQATGIPVTLWDERLSSTEADVHLRAAGKRGDAAKRERDTVAAAIILQAYLDHQRGEIPLPPPTEPLFDAPPRGGRGRSGRDGRRR